MTTTTMWWGRHGGCGGDDSGDVVGTTEVMRWVLKVVLVEDSEAEGV